MSDYCKEQYNKYKKRMETFSDIYNNDMEKGIKHATCTESHHCAYRYAKIHGVVERMGGWANFSSYVNDCAKTDYLVFEELAVENVELKKENDRLSRMVKNKFNNEGKIVKSLTCNTCSKVIEAENACTTGIGFLLGVVECKECWDTANETGI